MQRLLTQGISPDRLALTIALGIVLGLFPIIGFTSVLCAAAAMALRLNLPAIQAVNYFMYPLQIMMVLPFIRAGEFIFRANRTTLTLGQMLSLFKLNFWGAAHSLWLLALQGIAAWLLIAPLALLVVYAAVLFVARRIQPDMAAEITA